MCAFSCVAQVMDAAWRSTAGGEGGREEVVPMTKDGEGRARVGWRTEGPEEAGRSHGWSTPGMIERRHVETMKTASAKSSEARREVGHATSSGLAVWASKLSRRLVSWFGP